MVLLINPPHSIADGNIWKNIDRALPPLGLACIAAYLEQKGEQVKILDLQVEHLDFFLFREFLRSLRPEYIGISATTVEIEAAFTLARLAKDILHQSKIILGGVHASILPEEALMRPDVDFVIRQEGEITLHELVNAKPLATIAGLSYKEGAMCRHNADRAFIENLDAMPLPAYHLLPMKKYRPSLGNYKRLPASSMVTARGCPGRCTFCYTGILGKKIRARSAQSLLEEVKLLQKDYGIREISFYDDTFTALRVNVLDFCERIVKEKIDISWSCMSRIDFVDSEVLSMMRRAGCHQIGYGIESSNCRILEQIGKRIELGQAEKAVKLTQAAGIDVRVMFMLGNPGETEGSMRQTIRFAAGLNADVAIFNITTPYPGTEMYEWASSRGYLAQLEWNKFDLSHVVMNLPTVSAEKIYQCYRQAYKTFYFRLPYIARRFLKIRSFNDIKNNVRSFFSVLAFDS